MSVQDNIPDEYKITTNVHLESILRNKRCLLAYMQVREAEPFQGHSGGPPFTALLTPSPWAVLLLVVVCCEAPSGPHLCPAMGRRARHPTSTAGRSVGHATIKVGQAAGLHAAAHVPDTSCRLSGLHVSGCR